jgi:hypothetical protein
MKILDRLPVAEEHILLNVPGGRLRLKPYQIIVSVSISDVLSSCFADLEADRERPGGRKSSRRLGRERVHSSGIYGRSAAHPVRLRSSMSWAIQVFSEDGFPTTPSVFSS